MIKLGRREAMLGLAFGLAAAGRANAADERFDGATIRVATWGGSWRDRIHELIGTEFEKRGGKVEYVVANALENFNKLVAARGSKPPFDVMEFQSDLWRPLVESGFLVPMAGLEIPNATKRESVAVPTWTLEEGIVYNADKFKEAGLPVPQRYSDLLDAKYAGRVAWPDISYGPYALIGLATEFGGNELNVDPGLERIKKANLPYFYRSSVELSTKFASGDVWVAPWHAGWAVRVKRTGMPVAMTYPQVKDRHGVNASGMTGIVKGTEVQKAAQFWIDRYLSPEIQQAFCSANGIAPVNAKALETMRSDPLLASVMLLTPDDIAKTYSVDWERIDLGDIVDKWNRTTAK